MKDCEYIEFIAHMLDEAMLDKTISLSETDRKTYKVVLWDYSQHKCWGFLDKYAKPVERPGLPYEFATQRDAQAAKEQYRRSKSQIRGLVAVVKPFDSMAHEKTKQVRNVHKRNAAFVKYMDKVKQRDIERSERNTGLNERKVMKSKKQILEACAKWQKRLNENKCGKYTAKQIRETIAHWKRVCESGTNPYDIDNVKCSGWVAYLKSGKNTVGLPINFELPTVSDDESDVDVENGRKLATALPHRQCEVDFSGYGEGVGKTAVSFFNSANSCKKAVDGANIDSGAYFGTCAYIWDAVAAGILSEKDIGDMESGNVEVAETFVLGDGSVIIGRDALEDNAHEWELENP